MIIELNPISVVLLIEVLVVLVLLVCGFLLFSRNRSSSEQAAAYQFINEFEETENIKLIKIDEMVEQHCSMEADVIKKIQGEISQNERTLYQQVIQLFLNKDEKLLRKIDQTIANLSEPYQQLLNYSATNVAESEKLDVAESKIHKLTVASEYLDEQLRQAIKTMDKISAEYTRVFTGTQTVVELENSSQKMLKAFAECEQRIRASLKDAEL